MINPVITLFQKEMRQNCFIYIFPFFLITAALIFQKTISQILSINWAKNFAIAIPIAIAFSYALQAFDLEENSQTKDFLLTKPVTIPQIVKAKFLSGLLILLPLTIFWQFALIPDLIRWPDFIDLNSFWFLGYLLFVIIIYSFSFTIAAWVKGPKKLLVALFASTIGIVWFFYSWLQFLTQLYFTAFMVNILLLLTVLIITFSLLVFLIKCLLTTIYSKLLNHSITELINRLKTYLPLLLIPTFLYLGSMFQNPEIRPFNSLFTCLNDSEEPFFAVDITKQPQGNHYALTDIRGRLGIAERGQTPTIIYQGEKKAANILSKLIWSPDGTKIAFNENGVIKVLPLSQEKPIILIKGDISFWSPDSKVLLIATNIEPNPLTDNSIPSFNHYRLSYVSPDSKTVYELEGNLSFPGSSMFWHSTANTILAVTNYWELAVMNLNNGKIKMIKIPPPQKPESIFLTKIAPLTDDAYRIAIFTNLKVNKNIDNSYRYDLLLYDYTFSNKEIVLKANMKNLRYQDILINAEANQIWGSNSFGVYHKIKTP